MGQAFPEIEFGMADKSVKKISDFKGKALLVELVDMASPLSLAWAGAKGRPGPLILFAPQPGVPSLRQSFKKAGLSLEDPRLVHIQILVLSPERNPMRPWDFERWSRQFHQNLKKPPLLISGAPEFLLPPYDDETLSRLPGLFLVDKNGVVRSQAAGVEAERHLQSDLLPAAASLLK